MNMNNSGGMGMNNQMSMMGYNNNMMQQGGQQQQMPVGNMGMNNPGVMGNNPAQMVPQVQQQNPQQSNNPMTLQTPTMPGGPISAQVQQQHPQMGGQSLQQQQNTQYPFNIISLCKFGQESVQDIVNRFQDVFQSLRVSNPPNGTTAGQEKKVQEQFRTIRLLFKRVRLLYEKCNDSSQQGMEYTHVESLIPLKDEIDHKPEPVPSEEYKKTLQENRELLETVMLKNKQLREIIDHIRIIIWEINTMLSMRRS